MNNEQKIVVEVWEVLGPVEFASIVRAALLRRAGDVVTPALATERANNIAQAMVDVAVLGSKE